MPPAPIAWVFTQSPCNDWLPALAWGRGQQTPFSAFNSTWCLGRSCFVGEKVWIFWTFTSGNLEGKNLVFMILQIVISLVSQHIPWNCCVKKRSCVKSQGFSISGRVWGWNSQRSFQVRPQATSIHKPKQHGYDRSIPIKTFAAAKRGKENKETKNTQKTLTPKGFQRWKGFYRWYRWYEERGLPTQVNLPTMWSLVSSTFRPPQRSCEMLWKKRSVSLVGSVGYEVELGFGMICLH